MIYFLTVNYHSTELVTKLIASLASNQDIPYQLLIINNSPEDASIHLLKSASVSILEAESNLGFGNACNLGLTWIYTHSTEALVWIINPDAYLSENTLPKITPFFTTYPQLSILGTIIYTPNHEIWFAGGQFVAETGEIQTKDLTDTNLDYITCDWVSGCSLIINLRNFNTCPQFDPAYFLYYEDFDFCRRYAAQGYLIAITKQLAVIHQPSSITNRNIYRKIKHSTYSYLLTLSKYTKQPVLFLRLTRLIIYALALLPFKPQVAFGKITGVITYFRRSLLF